MYSFEELGFFYLTFKDFLNLSFLEFPSLSHWAQLSALRALRPKLNWPVKSGTGPFFNIFKIFWFLISPLFCPEVKDCNDYHHLSPHFDFEQKCAVK